MAFMQQPTASREPLIGGRYRVLSMLGRGGMGAVYHVRDEATGQDLALKRAVPQLASREMFEREYRTLASLRHFGIVQVFDYGLDGDAAFYTMELLQGADLSKRAPMPWREVCACLRDCASTLGVLHARGLLHRDLNPRNLWRLPDGRVKLLDFGALTHFGQASEVVGTLGFLPPESLRSGRLDQRSDLFALGALGYWLLTSTYAYRAESFAALEQAWQRPPAPPSSLVKLLELADKEIPEQLDKLLLSLLRPDPDERPSSTVATIDELNAIAGLTPESEDAVIRGYLESNVLIGRERERATFCACLARAMEGKPQALCVEGSAGIGRTRLLEELTITARMAGATVVYAAGGSGGRPYASATALARALLTALPGPALEAARSHAAVLGSLAPELALRLGHGLPARASAPPLSRQQKLEALSQWFFALAAQQTLVVVVDDVHRIDEESLALLATLERAEPGRRLFVLTTALGEQASVRRFQASGSRVVLPRLGQEQVVELLRSIFGSVSFLERLAARVHEVSCGVPGHVQLLLRHLVRAGVVRYVEGAWVLPSELPRDLPNTLDTGALSALDSLPAEVRRLARLASVPDSSALSRSVLAALHGTSAEATEQAIAKLLREGLFVESSEGLRLANPMLAPTLWRELNSQERAGAHFTIARCLTDTADPFVAMRKVLHLLRAGDFEAGGALMLTAARNTLTGTTETVRITAPLLAEACDLLRAAERVDEARLPALAALAYAGYTIDRSYAMRYGDETLEALQHALRFDLARRLQPILGGMPSLGFALVTASISLRVRGSGLGVFEIISWLVLATIALVGTASIRIDPQSGRRYAAALLPLVALGDDHAAAHMYRFCRALTLANEDRTAAAHELEKGIVARLRDPRPIRGLPDSTHAKILAGGYYAVGVRQAFALDARVLESAAALDEMGPMASSQADQLRAVYYRARGDQASAAALQKRIDASALQLGTGWQAEFWFPLRDLRLALLANDAVGAKHASEALAKLAVELPHLKVHERMARATYLLLRHKYADTRVLLEVEDEPLSYIGWSYGRGLLAGAYNGQGEYAKAELVSSDALRRLQPADLDFICFTLALQTEHAIAQAGLRRFDHAETQLEQLLQRSRDKGPLALGWLHRACARVAHLKGDRKRVEDALGWMEQQYRATTIPSLQRLSAELRRELLDVDVGTVSAEMPLTANDSHLVTRVQLMLTSDPTSSSERTQRALKIALDLASAAHGFIVFSDGLCVASPRQVPNTDAIRWAEARLEAAEDDGDHTVVGDSDDLIEDETIGVFDGVTHKLCYLWRRDGAPVGALVLASDEGQPQQPSAAVLRLIGESLASGDSSG